MQEGPSTRVLGPFLFFFLRPMRRRDQPTQRNRPVTAHCAGRWISPARAGRSRAPAKDHRSLGTSGKHQRVCVPRIDPIPSGCRCPTRSCRVRAARSPCGALRTLARARAPTRVSKPRNCNHCLRAGGIARRPGDLRYRNLYAVDDRAPRVGGRILFPGSVYVRHVPVADAR